MLKQIGDIEVSEPRYEPSFYSANDQQIVELRLQIETTGPATNQRLEDLAVSLRQVAHVDHVWYANITPMRGETPHSKTRKGLPGTWCVWLWSDPGAEIYANVLAELADYFQVSVEHTEAAADAVPVH